MGSQVFDSNIHTDQEAQIKLGDLTLRQDFTVSQTGYLNITQIGDDEATPVDTLAIYCNTTVGSASNRRTWEQFGGNATYHMAAAAIFLIDGASVAHTDVDGLLDINLTTATSDGVNAVNVLVTTHDLADGEWAMGLRATVDATAAVTATSNSAAIYLDTPTDPGATNVTYGIYIEAGWDFGLASLSPVMLATLTLAPAADPTPYPLDFQLEGWGVAGTGMAGIYTQGRVINMEYGAARTLDGALYGMYIDFDTLVTHGSQQITVFHTLVDATDFDYDNGSVGALINADLDNTIGPHIRMDVVHTQDSSFDILLGAATTVAAGETWRAFRFSDGGNALTVGAGETAHGLELDFITAAVASDATAHLFGILVTLPAAFSVAGDYAAFRATGNGNVVELLNGDGAYIYMREAASIAINIDVDVAADANNDQDVMTVTHDAQNTAAAAATHDGYLINYQMVLENTNGGGSLARTGNLIGIDINLTETAGAVTYAGPVFDINIARVGAGTPTVQGDIINVYVGQADATQMDTAADLTLLTLGAKLEVQAHTMRGIYVNIDNILNDATSADLIGIQIDFNDVISTAGNDITSLYMDTSGITLTDCDNVYGIYYNLRSIVEGDIDENIYGQYLKTELATVAAAITVTVNGDVYGVYIDDDFGAAATSAFALVGSYYGQRISATFAATSTVSGSAYGSYISLGGTGTMGDAGTDRVYGHYVNITLNGTLNAAVYGAEYNMDSTVNSDNDYYGIYVHKDASLNADGAAGITPSNLMAELSSAITNADDDAGHDIDNSIGGLSITLAHNANIQSVGAQTDQDTFSGTGLYINIDADTNAANAKLAVTERALDILYNIDRTVAGVLTLDPVDVCRIDIDVAAGVVFDSAGDFNMIFLDGNGFIPGATATANTNVVGMRIDLTSADLGADVSFTEFRGIRIDMPADYGTNGAGVANGNAAIYATGNTNIWSCLMGDGMYVQMREASSIAANIDIDQAADTANDLIGIAITKDMSNTSAAGVSMTNSVIDITVALTNSVALSTVDWNDYFIDLDYTASQADATNTFTGGFISMVTTESVGTLTIYGDMVSLTVVGTVDAGQTLKGYYLNADGVTAGAGETFYGIHVDASTLTTGGTIAGIYIEVPTGEDAILVSNGTISIGGAYNQGILFTEDPVAGNVEYSFINIGNYNTAIAVAPTSANMFGVMHNVSLTDVDVAYWYQAYYTKVTTSGTTTATSVAGHAYRMQIGSDLEAVYGIQCHTNITATNTCNQEIISVSALVDLAAGTVTTTDRVCALQATISGSGVAGTVVGDAFVAYLLNGGTVITTDAILKVHNQGAATTVEGIHIENDGTMTNALRIDNDGALANGIVFEGTITTGIDLSGATTTTALDTGAGLVDIGGDLDMTGGSGSWFRTPQMTTAERNAMSGAWGAGDAGKQCYDTDLEQFIGWDSAAWVVLG